MSPTELEKNNLEVHVELADMRERSIHAELDAHAEDIHNLKLVDVDLGSRIDAIEDNRNNQVIRWGSAIIVALLTTLGAIILKVLIPLFLGK